MTLVSTLPAGIVFPHGASGFAHSSSNLAHPGSLLALIRCFSSEGSFHDYPGHAFALRHKCGDYAMLGIVNNRII